MTRLSDEKKEAFTRKRIRRLVDDRGIALSAIAIRAGVENGTVRALYEQEGHCKKRVRVSNIAKLGKALDTLETSLGMVRRCSRCGRELPYGMFHFKHDNPNGINTICRDCKSSKGGKLNNNTQNAMTAEIVRRVKSEDKRDVESKFMAPYFGITPKQLEEVRKGQWDKLLLTPSEPKRADSVLESVENMRKELAALRREVQAVLVELGVDVAKVDN